MLERACARSSLEGPVVSFTLLRVIFYLSAREPRVPRMGRDERREDRGTHAARPSLSVLSTFRGCGREKEGKVRWINDVSFIPAGSPLILIHGQSPLVLVTRRVFY